MRPPLERPILLLIFNRPDKVRVLMEALAAVRPARLFISADGPRPHVSSDIERCAEARRVAQKLSWPCEIETNFSETNLGCKVGVSSAITWFFSRVEEGIILEDDCIPDPSFFPYCAELLERYRNNERVMHINGTTLLDINEVREPNHSYHFSHIDSVWGWATWRRAWKLYDIDMLYADTLYEDRATQKAFKRKIDLKFWLELFRHVREKNIDTWDAQ